MTIPVAHDFICPWCWIAFFQAKQLRREFPEVQFDWVGYELMPEALEWPEPAPDAPEVTTNRPKTPTRMDLAYAAQGMSAPTAERPKRMRSHNALEAVEYAKSEGVQDALVEKLYRAYWEEGKEINNIGVLRELADGIVGNLDDMQTAIEEKRFQNNIIGFDDDAYAAGVYNVPTYWIGGERYAEQPVYVLQDAINKAQ